MAIDTEFIASLYADIRSKDSHRFHRFLEKLANAFGIAHTSLWIPNVGGGTWGLLTEYSRSGQSDPQFVAEERFNTIEPKNPTLDELETRDQNPGRVTHRIHSRGDLVAILLWSGVPGDRVEEASSILGVLSESLGSELFGMIPWMLSGGEINTLFGDFFSRSIDGFFFMILDEPIQWDDHSDKEALLDYAFAHQRITKINDAMLNQYGSRREDFVGLTPNDLYAHDLQYGRKVWREFFDKGRLHVLTDERRLDGSQMWISGDYICIYDGRGRIVGHFGMQRDITEEKNLALALERTNERLRIATESAHVGIWEYNFSKDELFFSEQMYGICRLDPRKFTGKLQDWMEILHPDDWAQFSNMIRYCENFQEKTNFCIRLKQDQDVIRYLEVHAVPWREDQSQNLVGVCWDITEARTKQESLERISQELEEANVELEAAMQAKSQFIANVSHEIRTPLNGVIGMLSILGDSSLSEEQKKQVDIARLSGETLLAIVNDILDFSKMEANRIEMENLDFDLYASVEDIVQMLSFKAFEKGLEITTVFQKGLPKMVKGDPNRMRQILMNIIGNAVKFTEVGGVEIDVGLEHEDDNSVFLEFTVKDSGIGIPPENIPLLFQPYKQGDRTISRRYGGTGLGLMIAKKLIDSMKGKISVQSLPGQGTSIFFSVELKKSAEPYFLQEMVGNKLKKFHIAILSTNKRVAYSLKNYLEEYTKEVGLFDSSNNLEDYVLARQGIGDGVVCFIDKYFQDVIHPFAERILLDRKAKHRAKFALVVSGMDDMHSVPVLKVGYQAYLTKPFRIQSILTVLNQLTANMEDGEGTSPRSALRNVIEKSGDGLETDSPRMKSKRVLVAEDNPVNQMVAVALLKKLGYQADLANNGLEAVSMVEKGDYEILFMDCQMPEMDGFDATRAIRAWETKNNKKKVKIIAMTAYVSPEHQEKCMQVGMDDFISKPFSKEDIQSKIQNY